MNRRPRASSHRTFTLAAAAGGAAGVALGASRAAGQHYVEYGVNLSLGPTYYYEHYEQGAQPSGPIFQEHVIDGYGRVAGTANVGFGVNKARVDLAGTNPANPLFFEYGFASSRYFDSFTFDDPDLNGQHAFFRDDAVRGRQRFGEPRWTIRDFAEHRVRRVLARRHQRHR
jgi:hypothetical protein